jgi:hypothetical protein
MVKDGEQPAASGEWSKTGNAEWKRTANSEWRMANGWNGE